MTRIVTILTLAFALVVIGCQSAPDDADSSQDTTVVEQSYKSQLLEDINKKYESPEAHYQLGKLYYNEGQLDKADFQYRVAVGFDPVHYRAQAGLVRVLTDTKQADRAGIVAEIYTSQTAVSAKNSLDLGRALENEGLGKYALNCYYQAAGLDSESAEPFRRIGYYYLGQGDMVRAEESFRRSFELDPYQPDISGELGRLGIVIQTPRKSNVVVTP